MKFNIGDRVRFLSEKGGGVIVKINNRSIVTVRTDDDFDIPYHTKDLVKIEHKSSINDYFLTDSDKKTPDISAEIQVKEQKGEFDDERHSKIIRRQQGISLQEGVYLAWLPENQDLLILSNINMFIINNTNFDILFSLLLQNADKSFSGVDYDAIPAHHKILLRNFGRDKLEKWSNGVIQLLFHADKNFSVPNPVSASFKITASRFYKEDNYLEYNILNGRCLVFELKKSVKSISPLERKDMQETVPVVTSNARQVFPEAFIKRHLTSSNEAVVDLHIEKLSENYSQMTDAEILMYQLRYFQRCLESAINDNLYKITFIHGIGQGVLKKSLIDLLKDYENITIHDAPMRQFGLGAIELIVNK